MQSLKTLPQITLLLLSFFVFSLALTPFCMAATSSLQAAAESGDAKAQYQLAISNLTRKKTKPNYPVAVKWLKSAAEQGHTEAQYSLALRYLLGQGVYKNPQRAADWLQKAAEQNHPEAQYSLGLRFLWGQGREKDRDKALFWFEKAAQQGLAEAEKYLRPASPKSTSQKVKLADWQRTEQLIADYATTVFSSQKDDAFLHRKQQLEMQLTPKEVMLAIQRANRQRLAKQEKLSEAELYKKLDEPYKYQLRTAEDYFLTGNQLVRKGDLPLAIVAFTKSIQLDPGNPSSLRNLSATFAHLGELDKAIENLRKAIQLDPGHADKHATLGLIYHAAGDRPDALTEYRQAAALNPGLGWFYPDMADIFIQQKDYTAAWQAVKQAERLGHGKQRVHDRLDRFSPEEAQAIDDPKLISLHLRQLTLDSETAAKKALQSLRNGADFSRLQAKLDLKNNLQNGGYWGPYQPELLAPQFRTQLQNLPPFAFSPIIETAAGFHILQKFTFYHQLAKTD